jgi:signal peptidase II
MTSVQAPLLSSPAQRWLVPMLLGLFVLVADQLSKLWAVATLGPQPYQRTIPLVGDWLNLIYSRNTGVGARPFPP